MHVELHPRYQNTTEGQRGAELLSACVHCGFCLATCPTYLDTPDERDSPRGRIYLVKNLLEQGDASALTRQHLDRCLTCRSCETTCPSGMQYGALVDLGRGLVDELAPRPWWQRITRLALRKTLTSPRLFQPLIRLGQMLRPVLPKALAQAVPAPRQRQPTPSSQHRRRVLLLDGCVQAAATPQTNDAVIRILNALGIDGEFSVGAGCCGAVNYHLGAHDDGLDDMRRNIDAWWPAIEAGAEAVVTSASGCGATVHEYGQYLVGDPDYATRAAKISELAVDIAQLLASEVLTPLTAQTQQRVALHTPCTLQHVLGADEAVRSILQGAGIELTQTCDDHLCCGSAGTYSLLQPERSQRLRERKIAALTGDAPERIVTANVGCQLHLDAAATQPVHHWVELLDPSPVDPA